MNQNTESQYILVVDDNPNNLKVLSQTLTRAGLEIAIANNGENALKQINYDLPTLILLDVMMPGIDGFETCRRLKANPDTKDIPVIFMTVLSETADKVKGLSLGAVDYISKPFEAEEVLARVKVHLELRALHVTLERKNQQLSTALNKLKAAQQQIIKQEKLATIGALTTGIVHELRNPLNFINNYAEGSVELSDDLEEELDEQSEKIAPEALESIKELLNDIRENAQTIHHHGQRADNIIQNTLSQAREDNHQFQLTDLNTIVDQAVKLAYKSKRAQNSTFKLQISTNYDRKVGQYSLLRSEFSRALINLVDNACYALEVKHNQEKTKTTNFIATLWVTTKKLEDSIEICIRDNGLGIEPQIQEKIFQPFFTTKPMGDGTGLGLSLTHKAIVDKHGGSLKVYSKYGEYTEFIITLSNKNS